MIIERLKQDASFMRVLTRAGGWHKAYLIDEMELQKISATMIEAAERIEALERELEARATPALPQGEHDLEDVRCQCCGYMTYHSEHMGCIRSAYKQALPQVPEGMAIVPVEPTPKMIVAFRNSNGFQDGYKAMLAAAKEQSK